eukprot:sb/3463474/
MLNAPPFWICITQEDQLLLLPSPESPNTLSVDLMVVLNVRPWKRPRPVDPDAGQNDWFMFGFQDLASDYYQVLRERSRPRLCKFIWSILVTALFMLTVFLVYKLISDFFRFASFDQTSTIWVTAVPFPALTICNTNKINYTALRERFRASEPGLDAKFEHLMRDMGDIAAKGEYVPEEIDNSLVIDVLGWALKERVSLAKIGEAGVVTVGRYDYMFGGLGYNFTNTSHAPTEMGTCIEVNDDETMVQVIPGESGGFSITLDARTHDYMFTTDTRGFLVFIRDQGEVVLTNEGGYLAPTGMETRLRLTEERYKRLGKPHGTCQNVPGWFPGRQFETVRECLQRQRLELHFKYCQCIPEFLARRWYEAGDFDNLERAIEMLQTFDFDEMKMGRKRADRGGYEMYAGFTCDLVYSQLCHYEIESLLRNGTVGYTGCHEPCAYRCWHADQNLSPFPPTRQYFAAHLSEHRDHRPLNYTYAENNFARIRVFYPELKRKTTTQVKVYSIQNMVAELGGTVDLFVGFSFFTVFQLIEIGLAACCYRLCKSREEGEVQGSSCSEGERSEMDIEIL